MDTQQYVEHILDYPKDLIVDLDKFENVRLRYKNFTYKINIEKLLQEFGNLVEVITD